MITSLLWIFIICGMYAFQNVSMLNYEHFPITCYQCNSLATPACFNAVTTLPISHQPGDCTFCRKLYQEFSPSLGIDKRLIRECLRSNRWLGQHPDTGQVVWVYDEPKISGFHCHKREVANSVKTWSCTCKTKLCNGCRAPIPPVFLITPFCVLAIIMYCFQHNLF